MADAEAALLGNPLRRSIPWVTRVMRRANPVTGQAISNNRYCACARMLTMVMWRVIGPTYEQSARARARASDTRCRRPRAQVIGLLRGNVHLVDRRGPNNDIDCVVPIDFMIGSPRPFVYLIIRLIVARRLRRLLREQIMIGSFELLLNGRSIGKCL